jgi:hypothetical protein
MGERAQASSASSKAPNLGYNSFEPRGLWNVCLTVGAWLVAELADLGFDHQPLVLAGDPEKAEAHLPMIHLVFSNLKTWLLGTHHGRIEPQHLQAYLNEYVFRFNRRFYPMTAFNSALGLAARSVSPTYAQLYSGEWEHPGSALPIEAA